MAFADAVPVVKVAAVDDVHGVALVFDVGVEAKEFLVTDDGEVRREGVELVDLEVGVVLGVLADEVGDQAVLRDVVTPSGGGGRDAQLAVDAAGFLA
jgi:hypothetical protein